MLAKIPLLGFLLLALVIFTEVSDLQAANIFKSIFSGPKSSTQKNSEPAVSEINIQPTENIDANLSLLTNAIYLDDGNFIYVYKKLLSVYDGETLTAINTIYLKYLFLNGDKDGFMKVLTSFPDSYIFKTENYDFTKTDLMNVWIKAEEIEKYVSDQIAKKNYLQLLDDSYKDPHSLWRNNIGGIYGILFSEPKYHWATPKYYDDVASCPSDIPVYWHKKNDEVLNFLIKNFNAFYKNDETILLKLIYAADFPFYEKEANVKYIDKKYKGLKKVIEDFINKKDFVVDTYRQKSSDDNSLVEQKITFNISNFPIGKGDFDLKDINKIYENENIDVVVGVQFEGTIIYFKKSQSGKWAPLIDQRVPGCFG